MTCINISVNFSKCQKVLIFETSHVILLRKLGILLEEEVTIQLIEAGKKEQDHAIRKGQYHKEILSIVVVVDYGWSKYSDKCS